MSVALIGATGQLGTDLCLSLDGDVVRLEHGDIEITDAKDVSDVLSEVAPDCVINTAAYNQVDRAEEQAEQAFAVNALGPRNLAKVCGARNIALMHISSDYIFGIQADRDVPYRETDVPGPLSVYGLSKLAGEYFVRSLCPRHFIVRTCGLYGHGGKNGNFVETMLRLAKQRDGLRVVDDQQCTPTSSAHLAGLIPHLLDTNRYGVYHVTNSGSTSWYEFAREVFRLAKVGISVDPISTREFGAEAQRPAFSVLDNKKISGIVGYELPEWQDALSEYLQAK